MLSLGFVVSAARPCPRRSVRMSSGHSVPSSASSSRRAFLLSALSVSSAAIWTGVDSAMAVPINPAYPDKVTRYIPKGYPIENNQQPVTLDATKPVNKLEDGIEYQDVKTGTGAEVKPGSLAVAHWRVTLDNGLEVIDTRIDGKPVYFRVGLGQVEKGVDKSVVGMHVGGIRRVKAEATKAFSDITTGERSSIPSDGTVFIDLEVFGVDPYKR